MFGTVSPSLLSIATLKLWFFFITNLWIKPSESRSLSTWEFIIGYSVIAIEHAFTKNGNMVNFGWTDFISFLSLINYVASISSENVKKGIERDSVIVFVIAFFIPVICFTLKVKTNINLLITFYYTCQRGNFISTSIILRTLFIWWVWSLHGCLW